MPIRALIASLELAIHSQMPGLAIQCTVNVILGDFGEGINVAVPFNKIGNLWAPLINRLGFSPEAWAHMLKVIAKTDNDHSFGLRYFRGEVDIVGQPKPRDPGAVEAKKALIKATKTEASIAFPTDKTTTSRLGGLPDLPLEINWPLEDNIPTRLSP